MTYYGPSYSLEQELAFIDSLARFADKTKRRAMLGGYLIGMRGRVRAFDSVHNMTAEQHDICVRRAQVLLTAAGG